MGGFPSSFQWSTGVVSGPSPASLVLPASPGVAYVVDAVEASMKVATVENAGWLGAYLSLAVAATAIVYNFEDLIVNTSAMGSADSLSETPGIGFPTGAGVQMGFSQSFAGIVQSVRITGHVI